jgi:hypothetical protein
MSLTFQFGLPLLGCPIRFAFFANRMGFLKVQDVRRNEGPASLVKRSVLPRQNEERCSDLQRGLR